MATSSKKLRRSEAAWDDDDDMMLTQEDLALIDGLCSQQQFEDSRRERAHDLPRTCSAPFGDACNGRAAVQRGNGRAAEERSNKVDMMAPVQELQSEIQLKEMIVKLQQEVLTKSGLVAMLQEEQRMAKENAGNEHAAMDAKLKALKMESDRATEALRSQLAFLTKENDEAKRELQLQRQRLREEAASGGSQTPGPADAVEPTPQKVPPRSAVRLRRQLFPTAALGASPTLPGGFPTTSSFNALPARRAEPPPKRALVAPQPPATSTTPLKRSSSWLSNNSPTPEKPSEGHVGRARSSPDKSQGFQEGTAVDGRRGQQQGSDHRRGPERQSSIDRRRGPQRESDHSRGLERHSSLDRRRGPERNSSLDERRGLQRTSSVDRRRGQTPRFSPLDRRRRKGRSGSQEHSPTTVLPPSAADSPFAQTLDARLSLLALGNERYRLDRRLARALVALQDEMVTENIDFSVLSPLRTYEKQTKVDHPLCRDAQANYSAFTKNYHKYISVTLSADSPSESPTRSVDADDNFDKEDDEDEEQIEASCRRGEIKDWAVLLQLLPCLANHVRLFANELHRRRSYMADIDKDLIAAGGARGPKICPVTDSGPMDEFFDVVKELDMTPTDLGDCPHLLFTPALIKFRKQVSFALRWLLTMHQYCSQLRPWLHGEEMPNFPQAGNLVANLIRLLTDQRFYFQEELPIKRAALDLFSDICRQMPPARRAEAFEGVRPFHLLLLCSDTRPLSSLRCFEALQHLVQVPSFRKDFDLHRGRRHCLWSVVFHVVNKLHRETWPQQRYCELIHLFASFAIAAVRSKMRLLHRGCSCNRGMYEALATAALSQAQMMFYNRWESCTIEAVERPLRALLQLLQAQGVQQFEEITANLFSLFALISMLKRVETCRGYDRAMKAAMDMQLMNEFDDLDDDFHVGE